MRRSTLFACAFASAVLAAAAAGLTVIGSPSNIRQQHLDDVRSQDLQNIVTTLRFYRTRHGAFPDGLEQMRADGFVPFARFRDAESGMPYEYKLVDSTSYELCAQFSTVADSAGPPFRNSMFWMHPRGRHCFSVNDPPPAAVIR